MLQLVYYARIVIAIFNVLFQNLKNVFHEN